MVHPDRRCQGFVLIGGRSSRMGQDKALLTFGNLPLAARIANLVQSVCGGVTLVGSRAKYSSLGFPVIEDIFPNQGPLGGIHSALTHAHAPRSLIVGCDMPHLSSGFLELLLEIARDAEADAVVPETDSAGYEPLCAVYTQACLPPLEEALRNGQRKISHLLDQLRIRRVTPREWQLFDPHGKLFCNLNTPEEYTEAVTSGE